MKIYVTEEEQLQALQNWFKKNGSKVIISLVVVLLVIFSWNYWQKQDLKYKENASLLYEKLQNTQDKTTQYNIAKELVVKYESSVYGKIAGLILANKKASEQNWSEATKDYKNIYEQTKSWPDLQVIAFENWVRSNLEQKQLTEAYENLEKAEKNTDFTKIYPLNFYNLKGDVLFAQSKNKEAVEAYNKAIDYANNDPELQQQSAQFVNWIKLKRNDLLEAKKLA